MTDPLRLIPGEKTEIREPHQPRTLSEVTGDSFKGKPVPQREWLVPGWISLNTVTLLSGDGGVGKSQIALQLAVAAASGTEWLDKPIRHGRALVLSAEDDLPELHRRLDAIIANIGTGWECLAGLKLLPLAGEDAVLGTANGRTGVLEATELFRLVEKAVETWRPVAVVIDSLHDVFAGEENSRTQARQFIGLLRGVALRHSCAIVVLAHPSLSGIASGEGTSGSTAWNNAVRARLYLSRLGGDGELKGDPDVRTLEVKKANYAATGERINVRWVDGVFVPDGGGAPSLINLAAAHKAEEVFLDLLATYTAEKRYVSAQPSANYAPTVFARDHRSQRCGKASLTEAMNALLADRAIRVGEYGPPSKIRTRLERVGNGSDHLPTPFQRPSNGQSLELEQT